MAYSDIDKSKNRGVPIELYLFRYGEGSDQFFAYTDAEREFDFNGTTYTPAAIQRDDDASGGNRDRKDMTVKMFSQNEVLNLFNIYPPDEAVSLLIYSGHINDSDKDFVVIYSGRVLNASAGEASESSITCRTLASSSKQAGLRRNYQYGCPHVLYGTQCKALKSNVLRSLIVGGVGLNSISLAAGWEGDVAAAKYVGGFVQFSDGGNLTSRKILRLDDDSLTLVLSGPVGALAEGDALEAYPGCNLQDTDCYDIHDNIGNYGGQPWIPLENPVNNNLY